KPIASIKDPPITKTSKTATNTIVGATGKLATHFAISNGSLVIERNLPKIIAPTTSKTIIDVFFIVLINAVLNLSNDSFLITEEITKAPKAPNAPASVGVNQPINNPPITKANKINVGKTPIVDLNLSL